MAPLTRWYPTELLRRVANTAGPGLMLVFTQRDISYVVQPILDLPFRPRPCAQIGGSELVRYAVSRLVLPLIVRVR